MTQFKNWYICTNGQVGAMFYDKSEAYEIYKWMLTDEGRKDNFLTKDDEVTIHGSNLYPQELEKQLSQQKAFSEMLKEGLAE